MLSPEAQGRIVQIAYDCVKDVLSSTVVIEPTIEFPDKISIRIDFKGFREKFSQVFNDALAKADIS